MNFFTMPVPPGMPGGGAQQTQMIFPQQDSRGQEQYTIVPSNLVQGVPLMQSHDSSTTRSSWEVPQRQEETPTSLSMNGQSGGVNPSNPSESLSEVMVGLKQPLPEVLGLKVRANVRRVDGNALSTKTSDILRGMINEGNLDDENQSLNGQPRISGSASSLPMQVFPWRLVMPSLDTPVSAFSAQSNFEALLMALNAVSESASKSASESKNQTSLDTISKNKVYLAYLWASALGRFPKKDSKDVIGG